jgi:heat shock protein HtpX
MNYFRTALLLAALTGFFLVVGYLLGGQSGLILALVVALGMNLFAYWNSDKMVLRMSNAQEIGPNDAPELYGIVADLARRGGLPTPRVYIIDEVQPNAFATGRNPDHAAVAVTRGILSILDWSELRGVLAHEISHVGNRDILIGSVAAAVAMGITFVARMAMWGAMFGGGGGRDDDNNANPLALLAFSLQAPIAAMVIQMALSRSREYEADRTGARLIGDGEPLARALAKLEQGARAVPMAVDPAQASKYIVNPLTGRRVQFANLFTTHPPMEDRIARLRAGEWRS